MQLIEICSICGGALLLALAAYLGNRQRDTTEHPVQNYPVPGLSPESAARLQTSLTQLLNELHTLSRDMTVDLEQKLSELKDLLQVADMTLAEMSTAEMKQSSSSEPMPETRTDTEECPESPEPELQLTFEDDVAPPPPPNRYKEIYQMAEEGLPIDEIARRMRMGKGEIQLILSLRKKD